MKYEPPAMPIKELCLAVGVIIVWLNLLSYAKCQDSQPERMVNPISGEDGTWIPLWLEKQHVLDDAELQAKRAELARADETITELKAAQEDLDLALHELGAALNDLSFALEHQTKAALACETARHTDRVRARRVVVASAVFAVAAIVAGLVL